MTIRLSGQQDEQTADSVHPGSLARAGGQAASDNPLAPSFIDPSPSGLNITTVANPAPTSVGGALTSIPSSQLRYVKVGTSGQTIICLFEDQSGALTNLVSIAT